jgi:hypothetical protein
MLLNSMNRDPYCHDGVVLDAGYSHNAEGGPCFRTTTVPRDGERLRRPPQPDIRDLSELIGDEEVGDDVTVGDDVSLALGLSSEQLEKIKLEHSAARMQIQEQNDAKEKQRLKEEERQRCIDLGDAAFAKYSFLEALGCYQNASIAKIETCTKLVDLERTNRQTKQGFGQWNFLLRPPTNSHFFDAAGVPLTPQCIGTKVNHSKNCAQCVTGKVEKLKHFCRCCGDMLCPDCFNTRSRFPIIMDSHISSRKGEAIDSSTSWRVFKDKGERVVCHRCSSNFEKSGERTAHGVSHSSSQIHGLTVIQISIGPHRVVQCQISNQVLRVDEFPELILGSHIKTYYANAIDMPDDASSRCIRCCSEFTTLNRRHHCRLCKVLVCSTCCPRFHGSQRICNICRDLTL